LLFLSRIFTFITFLLLYLNVFNICVLYQRHTSRVYIIPHSRPIFCVIWLSTFLWGCRLSASLWFPGCRRTELQPWKCLMWRFTLHIWQAT